MSKKNRELEYKRLVELGNEERLKVSGLEAEFGDQAKPEAPKEAPKIPKRGKK